MKSMNAIHFVKIATAVRTAVRLLAIVFVVIYVNR